jgi:predicted amidohydrolase
MIQRIEATEREKANLMVFPEMTLAGYPPDD